MNTKKYISREEAINLIGISRKQTLDTTENFPKPTIVDGEILYSKKEVEKFFNIDNLDEPFIFADEAATILGVDVARLRYLASKNLIPFYRLKTIKGSGYMFKKSEIESTSKIPEISRNVVAVNFHLKNAIIKNAFADLIEVCYDRELRVYSRAHKIMKGHFVEDKTFEEIGQELNISRERVRQIVNKEISRIKCGYYIANPFEVFELKKEIASLKREIDFWKKEAQSKPESKKEYTFDMFESAYSMLSERLVDSDFSVRALNVFHNEDLHTIGELALLCYGTKVHFSALLGLRNLGRRTLEETVIFLNNIREEIMEKSGFDIIKLSNPEKGSLAEKIVEKIKNPQA